MKKILILALALAPMFAQAEMKLGTSATYDVEIAKENEESVKGSLKMAVTAVNEETQDLEITTEINIGETSETSSQSATKEEAEEMEKQIAELLANCEAMGGSPDKLETPAGLLDTCMVGKETEESLEVTWYANVPFFLAASLTLDKANGVVTSIILNSVKE